MDNASAAATAAIRTCNSTRIGEQRLLRLMTEMMSAAEAVETALSKEKLKSEQLKRIAEELKETNLHLRAVATEVDEKVANRVLEAQVENLLLKVELHKRRSKAAEVEVAEERCKSEKFALTRALQLAAASHQDTSSSSSRNRFLLESKHKKQGKIDDDINNNVFISRKEYEEKFGKLERELMTATHKNREMRTRVEQDISRAEAAEKAKAELEDKIKRRKEKEKEKKEFFKKLREQINSSSREATTSPNFVVVTKTPTIQTLSNVLEIPF